ncbi:MAG: hypothetical protein ACLR23_06360 [Clostridia bacterium]
MRRRTVAASGQKEANSSPAPSKRPCRRRNGIKNVRRYDEESQRPAGKGGKFLAAIVKTIMPAEKQD